MSSQTYRSLSGFLKPDRPTEPVGLRCRDISWLLSITAPGTGITAPGTEAGAIAITAVPGAMLPSPTFRPEPPPLPLAPLTAALAAARQGDYAPKLLARALLRNSLLRLNSMHETASRFACCRRPPHRLPTPDPSAGQLRIPLPFPFAFYNFNQGYQQPYYAQRAYYSQGDYCRPGSCTPARHVYFQRRYYRPRYQYYYRPRPQYYQQGYYQPEYYQQGGYYGPGWGGYGGW